MKNNKFPLALVISLAVVCQAYALGGWHDWSSTKMSALIKTNCTIEYSKAAYFQDSSLLVNYTPGASLTFPYNYTSSLTADGLFYMPFLNLASTRMQDTIKVEFLLNGVVKATIKMSGRKPGWNTIHYQQVNGEIGMGIDPFISTGLIPDKPTQIRITFPNNTGSVYLGKVLLCNNATWTTLKLLPFKDATNETTSFTLPATPATVSDTQHTELQKIATAIDETWGVSTLGQIANVPAATLTDIQTKYNSWGIVRNGNIINGKNRTMYNSVYDYTTVADTLGMLALNIAVNYRNTQSATDKANLLTKFYDVFDFAVFMGGQIFEAWNNGYKFATATYLMREPLTSSGRLTPELLNDFKRINGFSRIYLNESFMCKYQKLFSVRAYSPGELGEDLDYMRLVAWRLLMFNIMNPNVNEQVRDMTAISNYFSNIVFQYSPCAIDGLKPDGTLNHHIGWLDTYGGTTIYEMTKVVYALSHTSFQISYPAYSVMYNVVKSEDFRSYKSIIPSWMTCKNGNPNRDQYASIPARYGYMALSYNYNGSSSPDKFMAQTYLRAIGGEDQGGAYTYSPFDKNATRQLQTLGFTSNASPDGHKTFSYGAAFIHRRADWLVFMKTASKYQYVYESSDPFVTYMSHGVVSVVNNMYWRWTSTKMIASDIYTAGYDWRKLPGTTTVDFSNIQSIVNKEYHHYWPNTTLVGGVSQSGNGAFTNAIVGSSANGLGSFRANKSYFCFDNLIVCVGSNITNSISGQNTITTLFQDKIVATDGTFNNSTTATTTIPYTFDNAATTTPSWLMDSHKTGFWLPSGVNLSVRRQSQTNPNWLNTGNETGSFALAWLNHGIAPQAKNYWYMMNINCTTTAMDALNTTMQSTSPPVRLLANTSNLQMVEYAHSLQYAGVVINSASPINIKDIASVSKPCTFMVQDSLTYKKLSISYPELDFLQTATPTTGVAYFGQNLFWGYSKTNNVIIKLIGEWDIAVQQPAVTVLPRTETGFTSLSVNVKDGLPANILLKPFNNTAIYTVIKDNFRMWTEDQQLVISQSNDLIYTNSRCRIQNVNGITLKQFNLYNSLMKINISDLLPGFYLVINENKGCIGKFIKQ